jgi:hypothetical protein
LCFPSRAFWQATLVANGVAHILFLAFLFRYLAFGVHFLKDVGLIRNSVMCCKCGYQMCWCVDTNRKDVYRCRCRLITYASTSVRQVSWFQQSNLNFTKVLFLTYDIVRPVDLSATPHNPNKVMSQRNCLSPISAFQSCQSAQCVSLWRAHKHG